MTGDAWSDQVRALVERTCADQGVPVVVSERSVVDRVSTLLRPDGAVGRAHARSASTPPGPSGSEVPDRADSLDRHVSGASDAGEDFHVVDQRLDDGPLAVQVEVGPPSA